MTSTGEIKILFSVAAVVYYYKRMKLTFVTLTKKQT